MSDFEFPPVNSCVVHMSMAFTVKGKNGRSGSVMLVFAKVQKSNKVLVGTMVQIVQPLLLFYNPHNFNAGC